MQNFTYTPGQYGVKEAHYVSGMVTPGMTQLLIAVNQHADILNVLLAEIGDLKKQLASVTERQLQEDRATVQQWNRRNNSPR